MKITVATEIEITPAEYRERVEIKDDMPKFYLFDAVEYKSNYKQPHTAIITGFEPRAGGWYYHGRRLTMSGYENVSFSESDVIRKFKD